MTSSREATLVVPYYENPAMLQHQQAHWAALPRPYRGRLHVIVVDDGSPTTPAETVFDAALPLASYRLYRVGVDVRWNWLMCRNLGVAEAETEWVLLTDIDHVVPQATWKRVLKKDLEPETVYRFARVTAPGMEPYKPHPNSWLLTRLMFDCIGGYDERFSGYYGSDSEFRHRVEFHARRVKLLDEVLVRYPREVIPDASTTQYQRKEAQDAAIQQIRAERNRVPGWRPLRLTFPWERLA